MASPGLRGLLKGQESGPDPDLPQGGAQETEAEDGENSRRNGGARGCTGSPAEKLLCLGDRQAPGLPDTGQMQGSQQGGTDVVGLLQGASALPASFAQEGPPGFKDQGWAESGGLTKAP